MGVKLILVFLTYKFVWKTGGKLCDWVEKRIV